MKKNKKQYVIPIFIPHLGCPNDCVFCNQRSISGQKKNITSKDVKEIVDSFLENIKDKDAKKEIAFFGGSFNPCNMSCITWYMFWV